MKKKENPRKLLQVSLDHLVVLKEKRGDIPGAKLELYQLEITESEEQVWTIECFNAIISMTGNWLMSNVS